MPGVREAYITKLASYCRDMFTGTELYFGAHAKIEMAVLSDGSLDEAIELLKRSEKSLEDAKSLIGSVASLHEQLGGSETVDFGVQFDNLVLAAKAVGTAQMELGLLGESGTVQDKLWDQPTLTDNFVIATEAIMAAMAWQSSFAAQRVSVAV